MQAPAPVRRHPNASLSASGGGVGVGVVEVLLAFKVGLTALTGALIATFFSSAILVLGRHGLMGVWEFLKWGDDD